MIAFRDELYDGQFLRTLGHCTYGGADIGECFATAKQIRERDRDSWYAAWTALADRTFAAAEASARAGHRVSARTAFLRASNYYRTAYVFHLEPPLPAQVTAAYRRHREAFVRAGVAQPIEIAFEGTTLPGYFASGSGGPDLPPAGSDAKWRRGSIDGRRPLVISVGGYDSTAEESYFWNAAAATARGYHCVMFDGPGQGSLLIERGEPFRPDWERVIAAVVDAMAARTDVGDIVVIGESFGGYLAPRGVADDPRIAACVLDPAQIGVFRAMLARIPLPSHFKADLPRGPGWVISLLRWLLARVAKKPTAGWALRRGMLVHAVATPWDYLVETAKYEQEALIGDIRCPTLVCDAADDDIAAFAKPFYDRLTCDKDYIRFTGAEGAGGHCESGARSLVHERVFDWLDHQLSA